MKNLEWPPSIASVGQDINQADRRWQREAGSSWYRAPTSEAPDPLDPAVDEASGPLLVTASMVGDTAVFDKAGARVGRVFYVSIDKSSGETTHGLLGAGGFLGLGRRFHPLPWALFTYAPDRRGYMLPLSRAEIAAAPRLERNGLEWFGARYRSPFDQAFVNSYVDLPFA